MNKAELLKRMYELKGYLKPISCDQEDSYFQMIKTEYESILKSVEEDLTDKTKGEQL